MTSSKLEVVTTYGPGAASARTRVFTWLEMTGVDYRLTEYAGTADNQMSTLIRAPGRVFLGESRVRLRSYGRLGRVLLSRQASPLSSGSLEARLLKRAELGIYDFDDALYTAVGRFGRRGVFSKAQICTAAVSTADRVIAGNEVLAAWAASMCSDVRVIPTCVSPTDYVPKVEFELHDPPRICWLGSPSTERYLRLVADALLEVCARQGAEVYVVSRGAADLGPLTPVARRLEWSAELASTLGRLVDVGIAPLSDSAFARGKCAYKLLQYGAMGLPSVGSPVGANRQVLADLGQIAASTMDDWIAALEALLSETSSIRASRGQHGKVTVSEKYSYEAWRKEWLQSVNG